MTKANQNHKILIADDEAEIVDLVRLVLEWEGFEVCCVANGEQTLAHVGIDPPDLILLDMRMPRIGGLVVLEELQNDPLTASIPVIMLSVVTTYPEVRTALQCGAVAYLPKPFGLEEMVRLVKDVLATDEAGRRALREQTLRTLEIA
jgi:CheY-like chemotaxis protein